jgi:hypothetical protein
MTVLEQLLSIVANAIAILTFFFTRNAVARWATDVRRSVGAARYSTVGEATPEAIRIPHTNIQMQTAAVPGGRWKIMWSEGPTEGADRTALAEIRSFRLRWYLRFHKTARDFMICGEVCYLQSEDGRRQYVEITGLDYIVGDWFSEWIIRPLVSL